MSPTDEERALAARCPYCEEPILPDDEARTMPCIDADGIGVVRNWHRECLLRGVVGSVGHQLKRCSCYGGNYEDPPTLSKREAAIAAVQLAGMWKERN